MLFRENKIIFLYPIRIILINFNNDYECLNIMVKIHFISSKEKSKPYISMVQSVIQKLPEKIQQTIHLNCHIVFVDSSYGFYLGKPNGYLILLNINQISNDRLSPKDQQLICAHEFAHFILNHSESNKKNESEANKLISQWGF